MKDDYDFSKGKKRPEIARSLGAKKAVTIRLDESIVEYFRELGQEMDEPYQSLINSYLRDCVRKAKKPTGEWKVSGKKRPTTIKKTKAEKVVTASRSKKSAKAG